MIDYLRLRREMMSGEGANATELAAALEAADALQRALEEHNAALCPEDYGCKEWIAVLTRQRDAAEDRQLERGAQLSELHGALAERDAQIAHQAEVIAANRVAFDALQSVCEQRLREKDAALRAWLEVELQRARAEGWGNDAKVFAYVLARLRETPAPAPARLTEAQVETDPRFQHFLSGDYYQRGHKDDV